jgi:DNA-binding transcriptional MerR regulator
MHDMLESATWIEPAAGAAIASGDGAEETLAIGAVAREFGVTFRALRFYESRGLLAPLRIGPARRYRQADRERLALVLRGKKLGFTLDEIGEMIRAGAAGEASALDLNRRRCAEQINLLERKKRQIETALAELRLAYAAPDAAGRLAEAPAG